MSLELPTANRLAVAITAAIASPVGLAQSRTNVANDRGSSIRRLERDSRWQADAVWHPPARFSSEVGITPAHGRLNSARGPAMPANRLAPSFRRIVDGAAFNYGFSAIAHDVNIGGDSCLINM